MKRGALNRSCLQFSDASFGVVVDKGGLDALMGEDSAEGTEAGAKLLAEVSRVLAPQGVYLCVTLAQSHVLSAPYSRSSCSTILPLLMSRHKEASHNTEALDAVANQQMLLQAIASNLQPECCPPWSPPPSPPLFCHEHSSTLLNPPSA